ncbi:MAG: cellulase family glycosylhydrolase [Actinomycetota bacterium]|nr:cellulase family glycosylhydrolase [Actinomycetota bacterium]
MHRVLPHTRRLAALLGLLALCCFPAGARADRAAEVSIMDDQLLLGASQQKINGEMVRFRRLGVDRLRVSAFWNQHAPSPNSTRKLAGFDAGNPWDPAYNFGNLDRVIAGAHQHGLRVMISISTPAPIWATGAPARRNPVWKPNPTEFGLFARAVAGRYAGYADRFAVSNEPNHPTWLQPQSLGGRMVSPDLYRAMVRAAYPRIKSINPAASVLIGELAAMGSRVLAPGRPTRPLSFLRQLGCRTARYRPIRSGSCKGFQPIVAEGIGHHPYAFFQTPTSRSRNPNDAAIGDGGRLLRTLDRLTRVGALTPSRGRRFNVFYTEFGYQTRPPDPSGVSLGAQSRYLQQAAYIAWRTPRVREINQFRLTDGRIAGSGPKKYLEFQSGLLFRNRRKKPAFNAFPHPFVISGNRFWGQVRVGDGPHTVQVQRLRGRRWETVMRLLVSDPRGYFSRVLGGRLPGTYRYSYSNRTIKGTSATVRVR